MRIGILSLLVLMLTLCGNLSLFAYDSDSWSIETQQWLTFTDNQITLLYSPDINLRSLESRLRHRYFSVSAVEKDLFGNSEYGIENRITARLESILLRVKKILAMNPAFMNLNIKIYANRNELNNEYYRIFNSSQNYKSFYIHEFKTIYTSMQDITDSVIAHEMGHAVIDHYFNVTPPPKVAELLATYVDSHLEDD